MLRELADAGTAFRSDAAPSSSEPHIDVIDPKTQEVFANCASASAARCAADAFVEEHGYEPETVNVDGAGLVTTTLGDGDEVAPQASSARSLLAKLQDSDEPIFVLRAQDVLAAQLVQDWAHRANAMGSPHAKVIGALEIAEAMRAWSFKKVPD